MNYVARTVHWDDVDEEEEEDEAEDEEEAEEEEVEEKRWESKAPRRGWRRGRFLASPRSPGCDFIHSEPPMWIGGCQPAAFSRCHRVTN